MINIRKYGFPHPILAFTAKAPGHTDINVGGLRTHMRYES